jgi:RHS repeat-associated protein
MANGTPTTYTQDLASPLPVVLQAKTSNTTTLYLFDMSTRPLAEYDSAWEYLLPDGLGSVRQLADASGYVKLTEAYEPYGSVLSSQGSATSAFGFTGEQTDRYTQLVFLRARYMQPRLGVFLSHDPWDGDELRPLTYNGWSYVDGNLINRNDPSGWGTGGEPNNSGSGGTLMAGASGSAAVLSAPTLKALPVGQLDSCVQAKIWGQFGRPPKSRWWWHIYYSDPKTGGTVFGWVRSDGVRIITSPPPFEIELWRSAVSFGPSARIFNGWCSDNGAPSDDIKCPGKPVGTGHNGIDIVGGRDPGSSVRSDEDNVPGREVYSMAFGPITEEPNNANGQSLTLWHEHPNDGDPYNGELYWVQYTHIKLNGDYPQRYMVYNHMGFYSASYGKTGGTPHLHISIRKALVDADGSRGDLVDPTQLVPLH